MRGKAAECGRAEVEDEVRPEAKEAIAMTHAMNHFTVIASVGPGVHARPTPCAGWDLRTLLAHMTGQDHG